MYNILLTLDFYGFKKNPKISNNDSKCSQFFVNVGLKAYCESIVLDVNASAISERIRPHCFLLCKPRERHSRGSNQVTALTNLDQGPSQRGV